MTNKEKILRAAYKMIYQNGYEQTSVDELIRKAGVSKSNFYYHFRSKESLGIAVLDLRIEKYVNEIIDETLVNKRLTPLKRLESFYSKVAMFHKKNECKYGCPFGNLANELSRKNHKFRIKLSAFFEQWREKIELCLIDGIENKEFSDNLNPKLFSEIILAHLQGAILMSKTYKRINPLEKGSKEIINLLKAA
jgi:TetR/AcrR family transcriptional repressor of nem operon